MSIKQVLTIIVFAVVAVAMTACGTGIKDNPSADASVYGNGGMEVRKGDYVYFVNGFYSVSDITSSSNKSGKVVRGGIYRTKLVDGALQLDEDGNLTDCDRIVSKIVGYEFGGFYIYDNYIYYATPNNEKDKNGNLQKNRVDFYRCKIDGSSNSRIYTTTSEYSNVQFTVSKIKKGEKKYSVYLNVLDGDKLISYEFSKGKNKGRTTIADKDVDSVAWLEQVNYINDKTIDSGDVSAINKKVYYTVKNNNVNKIMSYDLVSGDENTVIDNGTATYTLKALKNNKLYYEKEQSGLKTFAENALSDGNSEKTIYNNSYSNYYVMEENDGAFGGGVIATGDNKTYYVPFGQSGDVALKIISDSVAYSILNVSGSKVYVRNASSQISVFDLNDSNYELTDLLNADVDAKNEDAKYVDFDGRFITYYGSVTVDSSTFYYTHLVDLATQEGESTYVDTFVGKYANGEEPKTDDEEEK